MKLLILIFFLCSVLNAEDDLKKFCKEKLESAESVRALEGGDAWLFPFKEIQHLAKEEQFSEKSLKVIEDYKNDLAKEGIKLLVVPIPPKSLILKEHLVSKSSEWNPYKKYHQKLKEQKVDSIDLVPTFYEAKKSAQVFCKRDSHFSPFMSDVIAKAISKKLDVNAKGEKYSIEKMEVSFEGDLTRQSPKEFEKEKFNIQYLTLNGAFPESNPQSPTLLLGDSNCLIYSAGGDMHTRGAGIFEYLSKSLGNNIDLLAVKGSGIDTARVDFFRRSMDINYLKNKKLVIWLFAAYELTESRGWKKIPVRREE